MQHASDLGGSSRKDSVFEQQVELADNDKIGGPQQPNSDPWDDEEYSRKEQEKIIRRVDLRLIFPLGLLLGANLLDRTNLGNAAIAG